MKQHEDSHQPDTRDRLYSEAVFRPLIDHMLDALLILDWDGTILFGNSACADLVELASPEDGIGRNTLEFVHPDFIAAIIGDQLAVMQDGGGFFNKYKLVTAKGHERWVEGLGTKIPFRGGTANLVTLRDITTRQQIEDSLRESEHRYHDLALFQQAILDSADYAIMATRPDGIITTFNAAAKRWLGFTDEEVIGKLTPIFFHEPQEIAAYAKELSDTLGRPVHPGFEVFITKPASGKADEREWTYIRKDGSALTISLSVTALHDETGNITGYLGIAIDMTERKKADEALRKLSRAVEQSPTSVVITDTDGNIEYVNPKFTQLTGYRAEEVIGQNPRILKSVEKKPEEYKELWDTITAGDEWRGVFHNRKKNGELYWESASISPVKDSEGRITHFVAVKEDITESKRVQEELEKAREAADAANRAKSDFLSNMSHEIRTPMNSIIGMAELLEDTPLSAQQAGYVRILKAAGESLLNIINDILDLSKVEAGVLTLESIPFSLQEVIGNACTLMADRAGKKKLQLSHHLSGGHCDMLIGDPRRLQQILTNLIGNAVKFTEQGTIDVTVTTERLPEEKDQQPSCLVHFSVRDTGIGIPPDKLTEIFERFTQADSTVTRRFGGTGLGLTISRQLTEMMGGRIWAESALGQGSVFHFTVRLGLQNAGEPHEVLPLPGRDEEIPQEKEPLRILLAEDSEDNRLLVLTYLKTSDYEVDVAENGAEAVELCLSRRYDLILMDIQMPVMDGYTATGLIRRQERERGLDRTPIIALTAYALKEDEKKSIEAGCDAHLTKPLRKAVLLAEIQQYAKKSAR